MSAPGDPLEQQTRHYGSMYAMSDYQSDVQNIYLSASYAFTTDFTFYGSFHFNQAKAELDQVIMPDITDQLYNEYTDQTDLTHQDFTFDEMHEYSDLEYQFMGFSVGFEYAFIKGTTWTVDGIYYDLKDERGFVYGDQTGSMFMIRSGLEFEF